jgi:putative DNA primase/helicase
MAAKVPCSDDLIRAAGLANLGKDPPIEAVETALRALRASLDETDADQLGREAVRAGAIRALKEAKVASPARWTDAALGPTAEKEDEEPGIAFEDPDPWGDQVCGLALLDELEEIIRRYLVLPGSAPVALVLWVLHAYGMDAWEVSPILAFSSPTKRCGKTTALAVLGALLPRPLFAANLTSASLFRATEAFRPTLIVDEGDTFLSEKDELRGVVNSGHLKATAFVLRTVGDDHRPKVFPTWGPKVFAGIGKLPDTLRDRSVEIRMSRKGPAETVDRLRAGRIFPALEPLRRKCLRWTTDRLDDLKESDPDIPGALNDRAADNWRCLLAIADVVGGPWPERARKAALDLSGVEDDTDVAVQLLVDIGAQFEERGRDRLPSSEIIEVLGEMEERPWSEWRNGKPLSPRAMARLLERFDIQPRLMKIGGKSRRGYELYDFTDALRRYVPSLEALLPLPSHESGASPGNLARYPDPPGNGSEDAEKPAPAGEVTEVTVPGPVPGLFDDDEDYRIAERLAIQTEQHP